MSFSHLNSNGVRLNNMLVEQNAAKAELRSKLAGYPATERKGIGNQLKSFGMMLLNIVR